MSDSNCAVCGAAGAAPQSACPKCHASPQWQDLFQATRLALEQYADLHKHGVLTAMQLQRAQEVVSSMQLEWSEIAKHDQPPPTDCGLKPGTQCRQCGRPVNENQSYCAVCGVAAGARAERLRYLDFALNLMTYRLAVEMPPDEAQRCLDALRARIGKLERVANIGAPTPTAPELAGTANPGRRNLIEILLDPRSIRWLLGSGGSMLAVGLAIWLSSLGVFKNAMVVASAMGLGTVAMLAGGGAMTRYTRHRLAGRAVALLGCLVMPLNLWFYNANGLMTVHGHLWLAAVACCVLYAGAAFVLEDLMFVYVLFGGITMTGMLVLADLHRLMEVSAPATLLVMLGLISLHVERAFADDDGPFSRKRFGLACFRSAHALIGLGLLLLLGSQLAAWAPSVGLDLAQALASNHLLSLALVLAGGYACLYSALVARQKGIYTRLAASCLAWAALLGVQILHLSDHPPALISALALASLAMNIAASVASRHPGAQAKQVAGPLRRVGLGFAAFALAIALSLYVRATFSGVIAISPFALTWSYVGALALTAVSCQAAASLNAPTRSQDGATHNAVTYLGVTYLAAAAAVIFAGVASLLSLIGLTTWPSQAPILMAIPFGYLLAWRFHKDGPAKTALPAIAGASAIALTLFGVVTAGSAWFNPMVGHGTDFCLAAFCLEAAVLFAAAAALRFGTPYIYLSAVMVCGMIYQFLGFWKLPIESCCIAMAVPGVIALIGHRLAGTRGPGKDSREGALLVSANALVSLPMASVIFLSVSRLIEGKANLSMVGAEAILGLLALLAAAVVSDGGARRWYFSLTIVQVLSGLLTLEQYSDLGLPRKLEMFAVVAGLVLLVVGYAIWYREQNGVRNGAGGCLLFGALLAGLPPAIFALVNRFGFDVSFVDELTLVTIAVLMFLTGMMCRIRATTLVGGGLLVCHLITLVIFAGMKAQLRVGVYVALGGAALFIIGLLLSIYRDLLLSMPLRFKRRQGLFHVLTWR